MKILHLEDSHMKAATIASRLRGDDIKLVMYWKEFERAIADDTSWDLLILDVCVPFLAWADGAGMYGNESLAAARSAGYAGPIIFITSNPTSLDLSGDAEASAYTSHDIMGWVDAIEAVRADRNAQ